MRKPAPIGLLTALITLLGGGGWTYHIPAQAADAEAIAALGKASGDMPVEEAFKVTATAVAPDRIEVTFKVNPCCYLYRGRMKFSGADGQVAALGNPEMPEGKKK